MEKLWSDDAWTEYLEYQQNDKRRLKKVNDLVKDIERNGVDNGIGKPEALKHKYTGCWSRRIDELNRLIYKIDENGYLNIISCKGHYEDK